MNRRTVKVIVILVGLLVLNIEAAQAGITHRFKVLIVREVSILQLVYVCGGLLTLSFLTYIICMPAFKKKEKVASTLKYFQSPPASIYQDKRNKIKKISDILKNA